MKSPNAFLVFLQILVVFHTPASTFHLSVIDQLNGLVDDHHDNPQGNSDNVDSWPPASKVDIKRVHRPGEEKQAKGDSILRESESKEGTASLGKFESETNLGSPNGLHVPEDKEKESSAEEDLESSGHRRAERAVTLEQRLADWLLQQKKVGKGKRKERAKLLNPKVDVNQDKSKENTDVSTTSDVRNTLTKPSILEKTNNGDATVYANNGREKKMAKSNVKPGKSGTADDITNLNSSKSKNVIKGQSPENARYIPKYNFYDGVLLAKKENGSNHYLHSDPLKQNKANSIDTSADLYDEYDDLDSFLQDSSINSHYDISDQDYIGNKVVFRDDEKFTSKHEQLEENINKILQEEYDQHISSFDTLENLVDQKPKLTILKRYLLKKDNVDTGDTMPMGKAVKVSAFKARLEDIKDRSSDMSKEEDQHSEINLAKPKDNIAKRSEDSIPQAQEFERSWRLKDSSPPELESGSSWRLEDSGPSEQEPGSSWTSKDSVPPEHESGHRWKTDIKLNDAKDDSIEKVKVLRNESQSGKMSKEPNAVEDVIGNLNFTPSRKLSEDVKRDTKKAEEDQKRRNHQATATSTPRRSTSELESSKKFQHPEIPVHRSEEALSMNDSTDGNSKQVKDQNGSIVNATQVNDQNYLILSHKTFHSNESSASEKGVGHVEQGRTKSAQVTGHPHVNQSNVPSLNAAASKMTTNISHWRNSKTIGQSHTQSGQTSKLTSQFSTEGSRTLSKDAEEKLIANRKRIVDTIVNISKIESEIIQLIKTSLDQQQEMNSSGLSIHDVNTTNANYSDSSDASDYGELIDQQRSKGNIYSPSLPVNTSDHDNYNHNPSKNDSEHLITYGHNASSPAEVNREGHEPRNSSFQVTVNETAILKSREEISLRGSGNQSSVVITLSGRSNQDQKDTLPATSHLKDGILLHIQGNNVTDAELPDADSMYGNSNLSYIVSSRSPTETQSHHKALNSSSQETGNKSAASSHQVPTLYRAYDLPLKNQTYRNVLDNDIHYTAKSQSPDTSNHTMTSSDTVSLLENSTTTSQISNDSNDNDGRVHLLKSTPKTMSQDRRSSDTNQLDNVHKGELHTEDFNSTSHHLPSLMNSDDWKNVTVSRPQTGTNDSSRAVALPFEHQVKSVHSLQQSATLLPIDNIASLQSLDQQTDHHNHRNSTNTKHMINNHGNSNNITTEYKITLDPISNITEGAPVLSKKRVQLLDHQTDTNASRKVFSIDDTRGNKTDSVDASHISLDGESNKTLFYKTDNSNTTSTAYTHKKLIPLTKMNNSLHLTNVTTFDKNANESFQSLKQNNHYKISDSTSVLRGKQTEQVANHNRKVINSPASAHQQNSRSFQNETVQSRDFSDVNTNNSVSTKNSGNISSDESRATVVARIGAAQIRTVGTDASHRNIPDSHSLSRSKVKETTHFLATNDIDNSTTTVNYNYTSIGKNNSYHHTGIISNASKHDRISTTQIDTDFRKSPSDARITFSNSSSSSSSSSSSHNISISTADSESVEESLNNTHLTNESSNHSNENPFIFTSDLLHDKQNSSSPGKLMSRKERQSGVHQPHANQEVNEKIQISHDKDKITDNQNSSHVVRDNSTKPEHGDFNSTVEQVELRAETPSAEGENVTQEKLPANISEERLPNGGPPETTPKFPEVSAYKVQDFSLGKPASEKKRPDSAKANDKPKGISTSNITNSGSKTINDSSSSSSSSGSVDCSETCTAEVAVPPPRSQAAVSAVLTTHFGPTKDQMIPFDLELLDLADNYDNSTGMFICTIPGTYVISLYLMSHPGAKVNARVFINNRPIAALWADDAKNAGFYPSSSTQTIAQLGFGDQVYVMLVDGGYGDSWVHANYNVFTVFLLYEQMF